MSLQCEYAMSKFDKFWNVFYTRLWDPQSNTVSPLPRILWCIMIDSGPFKTPIVDMAWLWTLMFSSSTFQPPSLCSNKYWGGEQFPHPLGITREQMCFNITNHSTTIEQISSGLNDDDGASKINLILSFSEARQQIVWLT